MSGTGILSTSDRKSTRLNSSHTEIYTLSLHDALPISLRLGTPVARVVRVELADDAYVEEKEHVWHRDTEHLRSEEHTSELQSHRDLHSFPTRRSSDLTPPRHARGPGSPGRARGRRLRRGERTCLAQGY